MRLRRGGFTGLTGPIRVKKCFLWKYPESCWRAINNFLKVFKILWNTKRRINSLYQGMTLVVVVLYLLATHCTRIIRASHNMIKNGHVCLYKDWLPQFEAAYQFRIWITWNSCNFLCLWVSSGNGCADEFVNTYAHASKSQELAAVGEAVKLPGAGTAGS